ncbi:protein of unknown function [Halogranum gelatinilyticum]|uniref:DUF4112 domain-containing protein n=1 Tax=Halogranum gelatinilyticum TaxID=660521 RepID=A0A1G9ZDB9_9EURY|nr:DUF4112 domain-containing protein [Halogranum gelatinilyticum]SDN19358.1 protein of unknown function [Halogranum gelatinilyticum]
MSSPDDVRDALGPDLAAELPDTVDAATIERLRRVAYVLDELVRVPGTNFRFGVDPVLGTLPVVGDVLSAGVSLYVVLESARLGVSYTTLLRMLANVGVDAAVGSIPLVGGLFDAVWKVNKRNLGLALADLTDGAVDLDDLDALDDLSDTTNDETGGSEASEPVVIDVEDASE